METLFGTGKLLLKELLPGLALLAMGAVGLVIFYRDLSDEVGMRLWISAELPSRGRAARRSGGVRHGRAERRHRRAQLQIQTQVHGRAQHRSPETFRIEPYAAGGGHITGGDLRGLMYGLLEAADQIRSTGHLKLTHSIPALALRGVRITVQPDSTSDSRWFGSGDFWQSYCAQMARSRFNRLELDFDLPPSSTALISLRNVTQIAQQFGVDVAIGFEAPGGRAIAELLRACPLVRTIVLHGEPPSNPSDVIEALYDAGRRVVLELPDNEKSAALIEAAGQSGQPLRMFSDYMGETFNPSPPDNYWDMDASQGAESVNAISGAGFEVRIPADAAGAEPVLDGVAAWGRLGYARAAPKPSN